MLRIHTGFQRRGDLKNSGSHFRGSHGVEVLSPKLEQRDQLVCVQLFHLDRCPLGVS